MGSAGLQWDIADVIAASRMNTKSRFVGTGAQISGLSTTYAGQEAYCTSTGSGFTADHIYERNAANAAWADISTYVPIIVLGDSQVYPYSTTLGDYTTLSNQLFDQSSEIHSFIDNYYNSSRWTAVGSGLTGIGSGIFRTGTADNTIERRFYRALGLTLSNSLWSAEFNFLYNAVATNPAGTVIFALTAGTGTPNSATQDMLAFRSSGAASVVCSYKDGAGALTDSTTIGISTATQYYCRLERTSTTNLRISIFSDAARTSHISGSPQNLTIPSTVTALTTIQHGNSNPAVTNSTYFDYSIANTVIYNGASGAIPKPLWGTITPTTNSEVNPFFTIDCTSAQEMAALAIHFNSASTITQFAIFVSSDGVNFTKMRSSNYSLWTAGTWGYIRFNRPTSTMRYIQVYGIDVGSAVMAVDEIRYLAVTESQYNRRHGHIVISPTDATLALTT